MLFLKSACVSLRLFVFLSLLFLANLSYAGLTCTETAVNIPASLLWAGASPNDVSTLNGSTSTPGHLQGRLKQCIPDGSVEGEQGTFEWLPPQAGDSAFFVGEINGPNSVALNGPNFNFVSIRMGNANFSGSLVANDVVIQDHLLNTKNNFNGVSIAATNSILIDSNDGEETPDIDLTVKFDGGGLLAHKDINIGALGRATTDITMNGSTLQADETLSIQPAFDGGGVVNMALNGSFSSVKKDVLISAVEGGKTNLTINGGNVSWATDSGFTTIGHSGDVDLKILGGADVNTHETFMGFGPQSHVTMKIDGAKWTSGNLVVGGFGDVDVTANSGAELNSKNTTIGSFINTPDNDATVTLNGDARWDIDGFLSIGAEGKGKLVLNDESTVNVFGATILGVLENSDGTLEVKSGDTFNAHTTLEVGRSGHGELKIAEGGHVDVGADMFIGTFETGLGVATVDGGLLTVDGNLNIGNGLAGSSQNINGRGQLIIERGGTLEIGSDKEIRVGRRKGSEGFLTLSGANSKILGGESAAQSIQVGIDGTGTLEVANRATLGGDDPQSFVFGQNETGSGTLKVNSGGVLRANDLVIADKGHGEGLVESGGKVEVEGTMTIGRANKSTNTFTVTGAGSKLEIGGELIIGEQELGQLIIKDNGQLDMTGSTSKVTLGEFAGSTGILSLYGNGQHFAHDTTIIVGEEGQGNLELFKGAQFTMGTAILGNKPTAHGHVRIQGDGSKYEVDGDLTLGVFGVGTIGVSEGGDLVTGGKTIIAAHQGPSASGVDIDDEGSTWEAAGDIVIGQEGEGQINITKNAKVDADGDILLGEKENSSGKLFVGSVADPEGATTEVAYETLHVAKNGVGQIEVINGATLKGKQNGSRVIVGEAANSNGAVVVKDHNSKWTAQNSLGFVVGGSGTGSVQVQEGALVEMDADSEFILGQNAGSVGRVTVDGGADSAVPGDLPSRFLSGKNVTIGQGGEGRLLITDGAEFKAADDADIVTSVGTQAGGRGIVGVKGEDSIWNTGELSLGDAGEAAVSVTEGAIVNSGSVVMKGNASHTTQALFEFSEWNLFNFDTGTNTQLDLNGSSRFNVRGTSNINGGFVNVVSSHYNAAGVDVNLSNNGGISLRGDQAVFDARNLNVTSGGSVSLHDQAAANVEDKMTVDAGKVFVFLDSKLRVGQQLDVKNGGFITAETGQVTVGSASAPLERGLTVGSGGTLSGNGTVFGNVLVEGGGVSGFGGTVKPGNSPGKLNVEGNFFLGTGAILGLEVAGTQAGFFDELSVSGMAHFAPNSFIEFTFLDGYLPKAGDTFSFVTAENGIEGLSNENFRFKDIDPSFMYDIQTENGRFTLAALNDGQVVTPEPMTMALMLPGMAGLFWYRRRKAG